MNLKLTLCAIDCMERGARWWGSNFFLINVRPIYKGFESLRISGQIKNQRAVLSSQSAVVVLSAQCSQDRRWKVQTSGSRISGSARRHSGAFPAAEIKCIPLLFGSDESGGVAGKAGLDKSDPQVAGITKGHQYPGAHNGSLESWKIEEPKRNNVPIELL